MKFIEYDSSFRGGRQSRREVHKKGLLGGFLVEVKGGLAVGYREGKVKQTKHTFLVRKFEVEAYVAMLLVHDVEDSLSFGPVGGEQAAIVDVPLVESNPATS